MLSRNIFAAVSVAVASLAVALPAEAKCTRLGFSVNDYGKDGPTKDALRLLDGHIAKWAADQGISKYRTGKKDVKCELFLNFIVFDEHTCRAEADVCWNEKGPSKKAATSAAATADKTDAKVAGSTAKKAGADITTGAIKKLDAAPKQ